MSLEKKSKTNQSLSRRILIKITFLLSISYIIFFIVLFFTLQDFLETKDKNLAKSKYDQISALLNDDDVININEFLSNHQLKYHLKDLLINIIGPDHVTLYHQYPENINHFDKHTIDYEIHKKSNHKGHFKILPKDIGHETIEVYSDKIKNNLNLMVGINTDDSEDFLWSFVNSLFIIITALSFLSISFSYYFIKKSLNPIKILINNMKLYQNHRTTKLSNVYNGEDEIKELTDVFNIMIDQTNQLFDSLQYSIDSMAHDLKTPISYILNKTQDAILYDNPKLKEEALQFTIQELKNLSTMLNTIMDISENEASNINLNLSNFKIEELFDECIELFKYASQDKSIIININKFDQDIAITADRSRLKQALINLISNSIKFSENEVIINISMSLNKNLLCINIKDNGWGITKEDQAKIWDRLYRSDKSRSTRGMGLGLALVKSIIKLHKGHISLKSEVGTGSEFIITIPI